MILKHIENKLVQLSSNKLRIVTKQTQRIRHCCTRSTSPLNWLSRNFPRRNTPRLKMGSLDPIQSSLLGPMRLFLSYCRKGHAISSSFPAGNLCILLPPSLRHPTNTQPGLFMLVEICSWATFSVHISVFQIVTVFFFFFF